MKLDTLPTKASTVEEVWYHEDLEVFIHSFLNANNEDRVRMLTKLSEISNVVSSSLADLVEKVIGHVLGHKRKLGYIGICVLSS